MSGATCWPTCVQASCPLCDTSVLTPHPLKHTHSLLPATASLPATIVTSSVPTSVAGHMMYPSPHTVMYASTPTLTDGGLAVLNAFSQGTSAMQVSHAQTQDTGGLNWKSSQISTMLQSLQMDNHVPPPQVLSLRCSSQHLQARCRSPSQRCSYTQYGKICILQVKLSYSLCNQHVM